MDKINLIWAVIWSVMAAFCLLAIFWNPSHFITLAISAAFAVMYWYDWRKYKK